MLQDKGSELETLVQTIKGDLNYWKKIGLDGTVFESNQCVDLKPAIWAIGRIEELLEEEAQR